MLLVYIQAATDGSDTERAITPSNCELSDILFKLAGGLYFILPLSVYCLLCTPIYERS